MQIRLLTHPLGVSEKLGDAKVKKAASDAMDMFCEGSSLGFALSQSYGSLSKLKAPKLLADSLLWIHQALQDFGISGVKIKELVEFIKTCLGNTNQTVRTNAVTVLGTLKMFVGPDIKMLVQDVNPALVSIIDAEFDKVSSKTTPTQFRPQRVIFSLIRVQSHLF